MAKLLTGGIATDKEGSIIDRTNIPAAKHHLKKVLKYKPDNFKALYNIAKIDYKQGELNLAKKKS